MAPDNKTTPAWGSSLTPQIDGHTLQFDPSAAQKGMQLAGDLARAMRGFKDAVTGQGLTTMPVIGNQPSGAALVAALNRRGYELETALDGHIKILEAMVDTFRSAGQAYRYADDVSAEQIDKAAATIKAIGNYKIGDGAKDAGLPKSGSRGTGVRFENGLGETKHDFPKDLEKWAKDPSHAKESIYVEWESAQDKNWDWLIAFRNSLNSDPYYYAGKDWQTLSDKVHSGVSDLATQIEGLSNSWHGTGSNAARQAVRDYAKNTQPLVDTMHAMSLLLDFTAHWVQYTYERMPDQPKTDSWCSDDIGMYRKRFETDYVANGKKTAETFPVIPPAPLDKPTPVDTPKTDAEKKEAERKEAERKDAERKEAERKEAERKEAERKEAERNNPGGGGGQPQGRHPGGQQPGGQQPGGQQPGGQQPNGQHPNGQNKNDKNQPNGQTPKGQTPNGQTPNGSNPNSNTPQGTSPNGSAGGAGGQDTSQLTSALSSLISGMTTGVSALSQQLPTMLQQLQSAMQSSDTSTLAHLLGVPEDKVTSAFAAVEKDPAKLAQLGQLLGLTPGTDVPSAGNPAGEVRAEALPFGSEARATGQVAGVPSLTNLFRSGLGADLATTVGAPEGAMVATSSAGAEPAGNPVDFVRDLASRLEHPDAVPGLPASPVEVPAQEVPVVER